VNLTEGEPIREDLIEMIESMVRGGDTPDDAARRLKRMEEADSVDAALREFRRRSGRVRTLTDPRIILGREGESWYTGPRDGDLFWPALLKQLESDPNWAEEDVSRLDNASSKIVSYLQPPGAGRIDTRGLVLGHVQAGKTTNYTAVIAKAADAGYKLFIVLAGVTNSLRRQTQRRLESQLVAPNDEQWGMLTSVDHDFRYHHNPNFWLTERNDQKILCVIKKNAFRLRTLLRWLGAASEELLRQCPVLVIDDEADQASVNASRYADEGERTKINGLVVDLLSTLPKAAYVGYTATPFANLFIDPVPEDLYPRHFIVDLPKPAGHFGTEAIFGREPLFDEEEGDDLDGYDMVRIVPDEEIEELQPPSREERFDFYPEVTPSLESALRYFWLATAARRARGQGDEHSTMLLHTTVFTDVHEKFIGPIEARGRDLAERLGRAESKLINSLRMQWEEEQRRVPASEFDLPAIGFDQVLDHLPKVLDATDVLADNYKARVRLDYAEEPRVVIVIGGNTLSRGITLQGLVVSYFIRTATAYDTLLQMGRWFGYRPGYVDLPRIWMTSELNDDFRALATVEHEIRLDIETYERRGITPLEFAVRIRTHPKLNITAALKMQNASQAQVSYSDRRIQTILFRHRDAGWLKANLDAGRALIGNSIGDGAIPQPLDGDSKWILRDVAAARVITFLEGYSFDENSYDLKSSLIRKYIEAQNEHDSLLSWNVVVMGIGRSDLGDIDFGLPERVPMINRARMNRPDQGYADIKALMSKPDRVVDLACSPEEIKGMNDAELQELRPEGIGLLLLYSIAKDSRPMRAVREGQTPRRVPLDAVEDVLGVGMVFPRAAFETPQTYMSANLSRYAGDEPEFDPDEEDEPDQTPAGAAA
jgi:ribosomal protein S21